MYFIIKSYIKSRLITERLSNYLSWGKFDTYFYASVVAACSYIGIVIIACFACEKLRFLAKTETGAAIFALAVVECLFLNRRGFYENTKAYLDVADEETIKKERKPIALVVIAMSSVYLIAVLIAVIKFILD